MDDHRSRTGVTRRSVLAGVSASAGALWAVPAQYARARDGTPDNIERVDVTARDVPSFSRTSSGRTFGRLTFRGGMVLSSAHKDFGGFSGLVIDKDGRDFVTVSDEGSWLSGRFDYDKSTPRGVSGARMGPLRALSGRNLRGKREMDCESIALESGTLKRGTVLLAFERIHRIGRCPIEDGVIGAPREYLTMPPETRQMKSNRGFEAVGVMAGGRYKGATIALCERLGGEDEPHAGWLWIGGKPQRFDLKNIGGFDLTDVATLEDGSILVLERRFRWTEGVQMQLRHVAATEVQPGGTLVGEILFTGGVGYELDNMEGLALHRDGNGVAIITIISDDNFNKFLQKTLVLQFAVAGL